MSQSSPPFYTFITEPDSPPHYALNGRIMVGAIIVLFLVIFLILMLHVYAKWFWSRSYARRGIAFTTTTRSAPVHTGLDKAAIEQLPTFVYQAPSSSVEAGHDAAAPMLECAVCLSEFQQNEKCRMLPSCKHTFHTECIDMWLFSHSTCPLCRMSVMPAATPTSPATPSTLEEHQGVEQQLAIEVSQDTTEGNHVASSAVEYPCNVLFWGNQAQVASSQDPSLSSATTFTRRALPQITIDITVVASTAGSLSSKSASCTPKDQAACSSQTPKSPSLRTSIKRMLSRQSSRHRSSNQEGNEMS